MGIPLAQLFSRIREGAASRKVMQSFCLEPESHQSLTLSLWVRVSLPQHLLGVSLWLVFSLKEVGERCILPRTISGGGCVCASSQPCLSSQALQNSQAVQCAGQGLWEWAAVGAAEFFKPLGMSWNVLKVPATVMSGSRGAPDLYLIYSLLSTVSPWSLSKLRCQIPDLTSVFHVSVTSGCCWWWKWLLEDGLCSLVQLCQPWLCQALALWCCR